MAIVPPKLFPCCIVWTPIHPITWLLPFVGHLGVCRMDGTILDFLGHFHIQVGDFGFGAPTRYLKLDVGRNGGTWRHRSGQSLDQWWDQELEQAATFFRRLEYNFCGTNCHSFVSFFLNSIDYNDSKRWNTVNLAILMFVRSRFVGLIGFLKTFLPFLVAMVLGLYFGRWKFCVAYLGLVLISVLYFTLYEYSCRAQVKLRDLRSIT